MSKGKPIKLTIPKIDAMEAGEEMCDALITGLIVRAGERGKSFLFRYTTHGGIPRRPKIGNYGPLTLDAAREIAKEWAAIVARGGDPKEEKDAKRAAAPPTTLGDLKARWEKEIKVAKKAREEEERTIRNNLSDFAPVRKSGRSLSDLSSSTIQLYESGWEYIIDFFKEDKTIASITKEKVMEFHESMLPKKRTNKIGGHKGGPIAANRHLNFLRNMINSAIKWGMISQGFVNPASEIPHYEERVRKRVLKNSEIGGFLKVVSEWRASKEKRKRNIARLAGLCFYNVGRRGEFMEARLSWINWEEGILLIPTSKTELWKEIPLGNEALDILIERYNEWEAAGSKMDQDWIIPGSDPRQHITNPKKMWAALLKAAGIPYEGKEKLTIHDLRRSFITNAAATGAGTLEQIRQIAGHTDASMTIRYAQRVNSEITRVIDQTAENIKKIQAKPELIRKMPESVRSTN